MQIMPLIDEEAAYFGGYILFIAKLKFVITI
jgi:hypothetical protein